MGNAKDVRLLLDVLAQVNACTMIRFIRVCLNRLFFGFYDFSKMPRNPDFENLVKFPKNQYNHTHNLIGLPLPFYDG